MVIPNPAVNHVVETPAIEGDLPCHTCGYNLRTQPIAGCCPECGRLIANSLKPPILRITDWGDVRNLRWWILILAVGLCIQPLEQLSRVLLNSQLLSLAGNSTVLLAQWRGQVVVVGQMVMLAACLLIGRVWLRNAPQRERRSAVLVCGLAVLGFLLALIVSAGTARLILRGSDLMPSIALTARVLTFLVVLGAAKVLRDIVVIQAARRLAGLGLGLVFGGAMLFVGEGFWATIVADTSPRGVGAGPFGLLLIPLSGYEAAVRAAWAWPIRPIVILATVSGLLAYSGALRRA